MYTTDLAWVHPLKSLIEQSGILVECPEVDKNLNFTGNSVRWLYIIREATQDRYEKDKELFSKLHSLSNESVHQILATDYPLPENKVLYLMTRKTGDIPEFDRMFGDSIKTRIRLSPQDVQAHIKQVTELRDELQEVLRSPSPLAAIDVWTEKTHQSDPEKSDLAELLVDRSGTMRIIIEGKYGGPMTERTERIPIEEQSVKLNPIDAVVNQLAGSAGMAKQLEGLHAGLGIQYSVERKPPGKGIVS